MIYENKETVKVALTHDSIILLSICRPEQSNVFNLIFLRELHGILQLINEDNNIKVIIISGLGRCFSEGLDLSFREKCAIEDDCNANAEPGNDDLQNRLFELLEELQICKYLLKKCSKPIIAAIHGSCVGAAIDLISSCDIRYCDEATIFSTKESNLKFYPEKGILQSLSILANNVSWIRDVCYTMRSFGASEALNFGVVSQMSDTGRDGVVSLALRAATAITQQSRVAISTAKFSLDFFRNPRYESNTEGDTYGSTLIEDKSQSVSALAPCTAPIFESLNQEDSIKSLIERAALLKASLPCRARVVCHPKAAKSKTISGCWKYFCCLAYDPETENDKHIMCTVRIYDKTGKPKLCGELLARMSSNSTSNYLRHLDKAHPFEGMDVRSRSCHSKEWKNRKLEEAAIEQIDISVQEKKGKKEERDKRMNANRFLAQEIEAIQHVFLGVTDV